MLNISKYFLTELLYIVRILIWKFFFLKSLRDVLNYMYALLSIKNIRQFYATAKKLPKTSPRFDNYRDL